MMQRSRPPIRSIEHDDVMTKREPIDSILRAVEQGRGPRGRRRAAAWSRYRALVLSYAYSGLLQVRIGGLLGISATHLSTLIGEACDAVLRGGAASAEADVVCINRWQGWCLGGDSVACERVQRGVPVAPPPRSRPRET